MSGRTTAVAVSFDTAALVGDGRGGDGVSNPANVRAHGYADLVAPGAVRHQDGAAAASVAQPGLGALRSVDDPPAERGAAPPRRQLGGPAVELDEAILNPRAVRAGAGDRRGARDVHGPRLDVVAALALVGVRLVDEDLDTVAPKAKPLARAQRHGQPPAFLREPAIDPPVVDIHARADPVCHAQRRADMRPGRLAQAYLKRRRARLSAEAGHPQQALIALRDDEPDVGDRAVATPAHRLRDRIVVPVVQVRTEPEQRAVVATWSRPQKARDVYPVDVDLREARAVAHMDDHPDRPRPLLHQRVFRGADEADELRPRRARATAHRSRARRRRGRPDRDQRERGHDHDDAGRRARAYIHSGSPISRTSGQTTGRPHPPTDRHRQPKPVSELPHSTLSAVVGTHELAIGRLRQKLERRHDIVGSDLCREPLIMAEAGVSTHEVSARLRHVDLPTTARYPEVREHTRPDAGSRRGQASRRAHTP